jgi:ABC-type antimicrobial peptide transport system permease subunit
LAAPGAPTLFVPVSQVPERLAATAHGPFPVNWIVRTRSATATVVPAVEEVMRREAPTLPMIRFIPMQQVIDEALQLQHLLWRVLGLFAAIALSLAAFGLYSLLSYAVVQRTKEIGISMALGATVSRVVGGFLREGLLLATAGVVMGLVTAIGVSRLVTRFIFGVAPADPTATATTAVLLLMVAALASLVPARRAARVDPMIALRCD